MTVFPLSEHFTNQSPQIQGALCSRICHDLISPLGAVKNGLELWGDNGDMAHEIYGLLLNSSTHALDRLNIYRHAFGMNGEKIITSFDRFLPLFDGTCRLFNWQGGVSQDSLESKTQDPQIARTYYSMLLTLLVAGDLLPIGGEVNLVNDQGTITFSGRGRLFQGKPEYMAILMGNYSPEDVLPTNVFAHHLWEHLRAEEQTLQVVHRLPDELKLMISPMESLALTGSLF